MSDLAPAVPNESTRMTVERYLGLVESGALGPDDHVELLEGVVVAMTPQNPPHASGVARADEVLRRGLGTMPAHVRPQLSLVLGRSVPEPDIAVVPGHVDDYVRAHPRTALLVIEVADTSLLQDRLSKAAIYAAAGIPDYWIVNLRDELVEVMRDPAAAEARYRQVRTAARGEWLELVALPACGVAVTELLPGAPRSR